MPLVMLATRADASTLTACTSGCMASGDITGCSSVTDYACLCQSTAYQSSVQECWAANCTASDTAAAQTYSEQACEYYLGGTSNSTTGTSNSTSSASSTATAYATDAPSVIPHSFVILQAVMSTVCSLILVAAICLGLLACRAKIRRENATQHRHVPPPSLQGIHADWRRSWTGVGGSTYGPSSMGGDTKNKFGFRSAKSGASSNMGGTASGHTSAFTNSRGGTSTFGGTDTFGSASQTVSFGAVGPHGQGGFGMRDGAQRGFTNRLTLGELEQEAEGEEWEMEIKEDKSAVLESPTRGESEVEYGGSTVHLNTLDKGQGGHAV